MSSLEATEVSLGYRETKSSKSKDPGPIRREYTFVGRRCPRKKSFPWNKSGGRQLVEMHGIRSVKGKAEAAQAAQQFRLECVYADASPPLPPPPPPPPPPSAFPPWVEQPQLLFFIGVGMYGWLYACVGRTKRNGRKRAHETGRRKEGKKKRKKRGQIGREKKSERKGGQAKEVEEATRGGGGKDRIGGGGSVELFVFYLRVSPPKSGWKKGGKGLGN